MTATEELFREDATLLVCDARLIEIVPEGSSATAVAG